LKRGVNKNVDFSDLMQEARQSIVTALHRFDPDRGNYFHTYADGWIGKAVSEELAASRSIIRVPDWALESLSKGAVKRDREAIFNPDPLDNPNSDALDRARLALNPILLSTPVAQSADDGGSTTLAETLSVEKDQQFDSDVEYYSKNRELVFNRIAEVLEPREFRVISMRSGLNGDQPADFKSIADELGVAPGTVRQVHRRALQKILAVVSGFEDKVGLFEDSD
jgi:RNA polymerase primary sigma factor